MDPPVTRKSASKKTKVNKKKQERTTKSKIELCEPKIENLLTMNMMIVEQRQSAKTKRKYTEISSGEEYENEEDMDDDYDEDEEEDVKPQSRRSTAAKRKSMAILSKGETESWGDYRNTIDNGPIPSHALTLNEIAFNVAFKMQYQTQHRRFNISYLDDDNQFEIINDAKLTEQLLLDTYRVQLSQADKNSPFVLPPFESIIHKNNTFTLNIGMGPIHSLDWLSMPTSACPITQQYLAIGCSRSSLISRHFYDETYSYSNYIQIWMFDLSDLKTNLAPVHHQLVCFIPLVDSGAIWSLKWSPACAAPSAYLAAGTSSGSIFLFKLFPSMNQTRSSSSSIHRPYPFYQSSKSIRLILNEPNNRTQCLAIDWSIEDPNRLVASYSNGFIALFDINIKAIHLTQIKTNHEKIIAPIRLVRIAHTPIRDVKFLNWSSSLILTVANISKRFSIWDLDDSHQHLIDIENSGTESVVRSLTGDLLCAKEFTPSFARTSAYLAYDLENSHLPKHIYFQSTPDHVLSIDYSPWLDAALLCDSNGQVYFFRLTNFVRWTRKNECSLKYRLKLFNLNAIRKSDNSQAAASSNTDGEPTFEQSSYSDLIENYLLDTNVCCDQKFVSKQDDFSKAGNYVLNALHKIRFNPNLGSYGWYALGGESGLLFILPINQAWSNHAASQYECENSSTI